MPGRLKFIVSNFFSGYVRQTTQEWIRLQLFGRGNINNEVDIILDPDDDIDNPPTNGLGSKRHGIHMSTLLYSLPRSLKTRGKSWDSRFPGWRSGMAGFTILAAIVLLFNITALIWGATHLDNGLYATIALNSRKNVDNLSFWIHLVVNMLSAGLLAGSNYCMQCLSSPTRDEVDNAHSKGFYLNIGILSWRNVLTFRKRRICLLVALVLSSIPLHSLYNSSVVADGAVQAYDSVVVTPDFFTGGAWSHHADVFWSQLPLSRLQASVTGGQAWNRTLWTNLSISECQKYNSLEYDRGTLILVVDINDRQFVVEQLPHGRDRHPDYIPDPIEEGTVLWSMQFPDYYFPNLLHVFDRWPSEISYCLSKKVPPRNRLQLHLGIMIVVVVLNVVKLTCFIRTFYEQTEEPFMTWGDAVASFLKQPYTGSKGLCLLSEREISSLLQRRGDQEDEEQSEMQDHIKRHTVRRLRYYHSISFARWLVYGTSCLFAIFVSLFYFNKILAHFTVEGSPPSYLWNLGFGKLDFHAKVSFMEPPDRPGGASPRDKAEMFYLFAPCIPQVIVSALYVALNYQLTVMVQLRDWKVLAARRQPLRVSDPESHSDQVSTYWLSLPYIYSIPLLFSSILFGWLVSQAIFYFRVSFYFDDGDPMQRWDTQNLKGIGYSPLAVICSILYGISVFAVSLAIGSQQCVPGPPLGPSNSLVIAAACHPPQNDRNAARKLVMWGAIPNTDSSEQRNLTGHCTITSRRVESPVEGRWYA